MGPRDPFHQHRDRLDTHVQADGQGGLPDRCGSVGPGWGNGKSIAVLFARQGAHIFGVDISAAAARETQAIIIGEGGTCEVATGDVTDAAQVARLVEACMARFGRIDVLVDNVGKSKPAIPGEMDEALWDSQLAVNLKSAFLCCQAVLPIMQKQGKGAVVSIASTAGIRYTGKPQAAYSAAKAGRKISPDERRRVPEKRSDRRH